MTIVRQDSISIGLSALSIALLFFLATWGVDVMVRSLFAVSLIVSAITLNMLIGQHEVDPGVDQVEWRQIYIWIAVSLGVIVILASTVPKLPLSIDTSGRQLSATDLFLIPRMFGMLIAVAEEMFFRGFATNFFITRVGSGVGIVMSGLFFGAYHLSVYGTDPSLMIYVIGAGVALSYAAYKTRRVSTTAIAHILNNAFSGV